MFDYDCAACGKRQLIFPSQVTHLINDDQGIAVLLTCWCGAPGALRTGKAARRDRGDGPAEPVHVLAS